MVITLSVNHLEAKWQGKRKLADGAGHDGKFLEPTLVPSLKEFAQSKPPPLLSMCVV